MLNPIPYLIYFVGPFLIALLLKRRLGAGWGIFLIGSPLFVLSQIGVGLIQGGVGLAGWGLNVSWTPALVTYSGCLAAGLCEESCRILGFKWLQRRGRPLTWGRGFMYAIGHSGMETIIVGLGMIGVVVATTFAADFLDAKTATMLGEFMAMSTGWAIILAAQRLFGGLLIHAVFTSMVMLYMQRKSRWWLLGAMALHATNNAIALSLQHRFDDPAFLGIYTVGLVVFYSSALYLLWRQVWRVGEQQA